MTSGAPRLPIFVTYGGGHVQIVVRLWRALAERHGIEAVVLGLTTAQKVLAAHDIPHLTCLGCIHDDPTYADAFRVGRPLVEGSWSDSAPISFEESCAYHGISMLDLMADSGEAEAHDRFAREGRAAFFPTRFMRGLLDRTRPGLTITTCNVRMEGASVAASGALGVPSMRVDDLFGYTVLGRDALEPDVIAPPPETLPDHIVVLNRFVGSRMTDAGVPEDRIHPLGQPALSATADEMALLPGDPELDRHNGPKASFFPAPLSLDLSLPVINEAARLRPDALFVVKFHPSTQTVELEPFDAVRPRNVVYRLSGDVLNLIKSSDLVITDSTTVTLSALFSGHEMLFLEFDPGRGPMYDLGQHPAANIASDPADAVQQITRRLASTGDTGSALELPLDHMFHNPASASGNIARLIMDLIGA